MTRLEPGADGMGAGVAPAPLVSWIAAEEHAQLVASRRQERPAAVRRRRTSASRRGGLALVAAAGLSGAATVGAATGEPLVDRALRGGVAASMAAAASTAPTWAVVVLATGAASLGW
ncbi:MAG: hypothetical protein ABIS47_09890, partial [Acidimicrobiales bacterium]